MLKSFNKIIYPYSKISRLPKFPQTSVLLIRNIFSSPPKYSFVSDCMATSNNFSFIETHRFQLAQKRAIEARGFDYRIPLRIHQAIWCADQALKLNPEASFVELGTGRGYVMSAVLGSYEGLAPIINVPPMFLFDTFEPTSTELKSGQDSKLGKNIYYAESFEDVQLSFSKYPNITLVKGRLPESLENVMQDIGKISFLHVDLNAPEVEIECLLRLWDRIILGAIILIDYYACGGFEYRYDLMNKIAEKLNISILTTASGQGIAIK